MTTGVLLMTFGSAETAAGVVEYMRSVRGGTEPSEQIVSEFERRFALIGRSPLLTVTNEQSEALQRLLDAEFGSRRYRTAVGMLHSAPRIGDSVAALAKSCDEILGVILSPQYSPEIMSGYGVAFDAALEQNGIRGQIAGAWYMLQSFQAALANRVTRALEALPADIPVVFTAHSMPRRVVDRDPDYIASVKATAAGVAARAGIDVSRWQFAYQSAGHSPEEWLRPDFTELLPALREAGHRQVLVVPTQFVADHLEVLYDIDIAGSEEAERLGMKMHRTKMPNASPFFIRTLADVVARQRASQPV